MKDFFIEITAFVPDNEKCCVLNHVFKRIPEESQSTNGVRPNVCCGESGERNHNQKQNKQPHRLIQYFGKRSAQFRRKVQPTNLLLFSEGVAKQMDKVKPADI